MLEQSTNKHLTRAEIVKSGSIYTSSALVDLVHSLVSPFITEDSVIADLGAGYGAFLEKFKNCGKHCFGTECDNLSFQLLKEQYPALDIYHENSLCGVHREKYHLQSNDHLIIIGNPPYNDTTSIFKKGEKGNIVCDPDLRSRDFGVCFLKAYDKLGADYVCVLHPLAYLIKKQNFKALGAFKEHYKLLSATIFSSKEFESIQKTNAEFPVVCALYEKDGRGMEYEDVLQFSFSIYQSQATFILGEVATIDGIVNKYPKKKKQAPLGYEIDLLGEKVENTDSEPRLQFYTLRDMNALCRNKAFLEGPIANGVDITLGNLYQYAWLYFLKCNFKPKKNKFLFGNLSPLYTEALERAEFKNMVVSYAVQHCALIEKYFDLQKIKALYGPLTEQYNALFEQLEVISNLFN